MPDRSRKRPRDTNLLARSIVDAATSEDAPEEDTRDEISKAAAALSRLGPGSAVTDPAVRTFYETPAR